MAYSVYGAVEDIPGPWMFVIVVEIIGHVNRMPFATRLPKMSVADAKAFLEELKDPETRYAIGAHNMMAESQRRHKILKAAEIREAQEHFKAFQKEEKKAAKEAAKEANKKMKESS